MTKLASGLPRALASALAATALVAVLSYGLAHTLPAHADTTATSTPVITATTTDPSATSTDPVATSTDTTATTTTATSTDTGSTTPTTDTSSTTTATQPTVVLSPVLGTDKSDYHPGDTVIVSGDSFSPLTQYLLKIFGSDPSGGNYVENDQNLTSDGNGAFTAAPYTLDNLYRPFYEMVASALDGTVVADSFFRDSAIGTYDQCSNDQGTGYTSADTGCRWINGNLNGNNSKYQEGDATPQRLWIEGFGPGETHTVTFSYGTTKSGKHAYDYLTTFNASENWITVADQCQGITNCTSATEHTTAMQNDPNVTDTIESSPASRFFTIRGGTIGNVSVPTIASGDYTGDSETTVTVTFTTDATGTPMCTTTTSGHGSSQVTVTTCDVAIWFGAHIAKSDQWTTFNNTTGAESIPGSPYHVALAAEDGASVGQRDNQMQASAIVQPSTITIHKVTDPSSDTTTSFSFTTTGTGYSGFNLTGGTQNAQSVAPGSYTVTEGSVSGWSNTNVTCTASGTGTSATPNVGGHSASITIGSGGGGTVDCTFTNTLQQGHLTLVKTVTNDNGGSALPTDWTLSASGPTPISGHSGDASVTNAAVNAGTYTLSESGGPSGYTAGNWSCTAGTLTGSSLQLAAGQSATCTINNDDQAAHLIVIKHVVNDNGGTKVASDFQTTITGVSTANPTAAGAESPGVDNTLTTVGSYSVDEGTHTGYDKTLSTDCSGTIALGQTKTCTITNDDQAAHLTLVKTVTNNNGGTAAATDWTLSATGPTNISGATGATSVTNAAVNPGSYNLAESGGPSGYSAGGWSCVGGSQSSSMITLAAGESATCTINNDDIAPQLVVIKHVVNDNGGTKTAADFTMNVTGTNVSSASFAGAENPGTTVTLDAGSYSVGEGSVAGYTQTSATADCSGTIAVGETKTCTITNDDSAPALTLVKQVNNTHGGTAAATDWTLTATGPTTISGAGGTTSGASFSAGTYTLSESAGPAHYTASSWSCTGDVTNSGDSITLANGQSATCTITNSDTPAHLTVIKHVVNDNGGTKTAADFTMGVTGTNVSNLSFAGAESPGTTVALDAGSYSVSEGSVAGYTQTNATADCSGTIAMGESKTCTITNDDIAPKLHLRKVVVNDNGGTAVATDWTLTADGTGANDLTGTTPVDSGASLQADTFALSESAGPAGYSASAWSCVGGSQSGSDITVGIGEEATCTITNDDIQPKLTLTKIVVNDNGGTKQVSDFPLFVNSTQVSSGVQNGFDAGTYTASETSDPNYTASAWSGDCAADGSVTLAPGDVKRCTITNDDNAPSLTLVKHVTNDNGGTAVPTDWTLTATGPTTISGAGGTTSGTGFSAGTYALSESAGPAGYSAGTWSCTGDVTNSGDSITLGLGQHATCEITNDDTPAHLIVIKHVVNDNGGTNVASDFTTTISGVSTANPTAAGAESPGVDNTLTTVGSYSVDEGTHTGYDKTLSADCTGTIALGETKTCTITNDDTAPKLHLRKVVVNDNGGTATSADFTLTADGTGSNDLSGTSPVDSGATLQADTFALSETNLTGYTASAWSCVGGTQNGANVTVGIGEEATCTITNDDQPAHLIVIKHVINDDGDVAQASDFTMHLTGTNLSQNDFPGSETGIDVTLNAGTYSADETNSNGYVKTLSTDCTGTIAVGETKTCTITNNDIPHATRTLGFWQTHTTYTSSWFASLSPLVIGTHSIDTTSKLFAGFYASISKTSTGAKRSQLDQARMQLLQQWLAAELNCKAFGCSAGTQTLLTNAANAFAGTDRNLILSYASQLDAYNNSNDALPISGQGKATPKDSQSLASSALSFWNALP